jgi:hypothetical protein
MKLLCDQAEPLKTPQCEQDSFLQFHSSQILQGKTLV